MENASKALIIAGSVLIAILLIGFGMKIFNSTSGTADDVKSTAEITSMATFNGKFTAYVGENKSAAMVKSLANVIIANNATNSEHKVSISGLTVDETNKAVEITSAVANLSGSYKIEIPSTGGYDTNGYIKLIHISK